ncbi:MULTISPECIES: dTMP kinase [unclassified Paenibacillus]|uniref:dTMP kinase n=1 Tax=unclassified Paenibacillus TaxID=185978 RepID=UPI002406B915|nr:MULTISPECIES: dTMP kinase [unclassified Paenibacillus]MDF9844147.1 dTMP kinase [Paenibacillus sp. PastF-2]MDF9850730.1 dTMP kinase [Paenibacillus sp. PastM-2]MDF9857301.1 dTMP kinase [Paenibacillus sp. PastF-1]MDH6482591.1 dTMP kinase [Paenibacillus sp. PastH-2]MDH6510018.1 dTMP kinase [Paenibacillus sp. PastM-3]
MTIEFSNESFPGLLITFCGVDGSGKTTMLDLLEQKLQATQSLPVYRTFQPTKSVRQSELFRKFVDSDQHDGLEYRSLSLLTVSDRVQHSMQDIFPRLKRGEIVLCDRYFFSAIVNLRVRGYPHDRWIYEIASFLPKPDIAFFMDIDFEATIQRVKSRQAEKDRWVDMEFQRKLHQEFREICTESNGVRIHTDTVPAVTFEQVWRLVAPALARKRGEGTIDA